VNSFYLTIIDGDDRKCFVHATFFIAHLQRPASPLFDQILTTFLQKERSAIIEVRMRRSGDDWVTWELQCLEAAGAALAKLSCHSPELRYPDQEWHKDVRQILESVQRHLNCPGTDDPDLEILKNRIAEIAMLAMEEERRLS
jgi:hypothetical protein